ncbi:MAG: DEAD/DEAH box helicase [Lentisphaeria bacterium]
MPSPNRKIPYEYPEHPPQWLPEWPSEEQVRKSFAPGIRRYAAEIIRKSRVVRVNWDADSLTVNVGSQRAVWRLSRGEWRRNCSCGYKNDLCVHAYAAARIFGQVVELENWLRNHAPDSNTTANGRGKANAAPRHRSAADRRNVQIPLWGSQVEEEGHATGGKLDVEADFHHQAGKVALRFYEYHQGRRRLLRLQQIYNLGLRQRHSTNNNRWNDADRRFLKWIADRLRGRQCLQQNLKLLKLSKREFGQWQDIWADTPGRFIDRDTQAVLGSEKVQAGMHIELSNCADAKVEIALMVTAPDGKQHPYYEIYQKLIAGSSEVVVEGQQLVLNSPFSYDLLKEVFSKKQPRMPRDKVCDYLPSLLENRLDIVFGPAVEHRQKEAQCHVYAGAEGANIVLSFKLDDVAVQPETMKASGTLKFEGGMLVIYDHVSPDLDALRNFVHDLETEATGKTAIRVPGRAATVQALVRGWSELPDSINRHVEPALKPLLQSPVDLDPVLLCNPRGTFVDLAVIWNSGNIELSQSEVKRALEKNQPAVRTTGGLWAMLDLSALSRRTEALGKAGLDGRARLFRPDAQSVVEACQNAAGARFAEHCAAVGEQLVKQSFPPALDIPPGLAEIMRHYQKDGFNFLGDRARYGLGPILADDMGLGKTLQVLAFLAARRARGQGAPDIADKPILVICPASVTGVWEHETEKFPLKLKSIIYAGKPDEREMILRQPEADLIIVNYALVRQDADVFRKYSFDVIVLDEAQYIKNPAAQVTTVIKSLEADQRLALTGTPLENRALDLWSIMDFLNPGYLGSVKEFSEKFEAGLEGSENLGHRIAPVMLRRTKQEVAPELPSRTEETIAVELTKPQREMYKEHLERARKTLREKGPIEILAALTRLRQICCHPALVDDSSADIGSAKLDTLGEMLEEITSEGHSALVFSQFASVLGLIKDDLQARSVNSLTITGQTPTAKRRDLTREFSESADPQVFLLSLKAAGTGLTLTKADYVFLFDPWWNPAVENQAIDRTHRIGQDKPVMAYRLVAANTIEENVMKLKTQKAEFFDQVMQNATGRAIASRLSATDLQALLSTEL